MFLIEVTNEFTMRGRLNKGIREKCKLFATGDKLALPLIIKIESHMWMELQGDDFYGASNLVKSGSND
jgi:hypothetical protein